jgi:FeS assembly protein IscX
MDWKDTDEIALALYEAYPDLDPLSLRFTELHRLVLELPEFDGTAEGSNESKLEAIQMAWLDEYNDE